MAPLHLSTMHTHSPLASPLKHYDDDDDDDDTHEDENDERAVGEEFCCGVGWGVWT